MKVDPEIVIECDQQVYRPEEDSYLLLSAVILNPGRSVLEVGCGTGLISLHCAKAGGKVTATDISPEAVRCTRSNAKRNGLTLEAIQSDLFEKIEGAFDIIIFNPPYLPRDHVDDRQWTGGDSGLESALEFIGQAKNYLTRNGKILILCSSLSDHGEFGKYAAEMGFEVKTIEEKQLFFEVLSVHELCLPDR